MMVEATKQISFCVYAIAQSNTRSLHCRVDYDGKHSEVGVGGKKSECTYKQYAI
jgi:hypothetical protein